jgi:hypothetical protein
VSGFVRAPLGEAADAVVSPRARVEEAVLPGGTVRRARHDPGWRWSADVGGARGESACPRTHTGYVVAGRLGLRLADGTEVELEEGDAFAIPPQHDAWTIGDEPCVYVEFVP